MKTKIHPAMQYVKDIKSGKIIACQWLKLAVQRHLNDLERIGDEDFPYIFSDDMANSAIEFMSFVKHSKGRWAGQIFQPEPWQIFFIYVLFGWVHKTSLDRRFRLSFLSIARKNGKTFLAAAIALYLMDGDNEQGAEVYCVATKLAQAQICHTDCERMVRSSVFLKDHIKINVNNTFCIETNSFLRPLGKDHSSMDGLNSHGVIIDELHAHKNRDLFDIMETSTGSRTQPLIFSITTAGFNKQSLCFEMSEHTKKILEGAIVDDTFLGFIYGQDEDDDWEDETLYAKSNPNIGVSVLVEDLVMKRNRAKEIPSALNSFLRLHLNQWTDSVTCWITSDVWAACGGEIGDPIGRLCYGGLDLASTRDISAWILVFPPVVGDDYIVLCRFFIPEDQMHQRTRTDRVPYETWVRQGYITATPGKAIDYNYILAQIREDTEKYEISELAFDRWGSAQLVNSLREEGYENEKDNPHTMRFLIPFGQGFSSMSSPMKELEKLVLMKKIKHGNNPVLNWMAANVVAVEDPAGNIKPDKSKSTEKIDGIVALIMALDRAVKREHGDEMQWIPSVC